MFSGHGLSARLFVSPIRSHAIVPTAHLPEEKLRLGDVKSFAQVTLHIREELGFELERVSSKHLLAQEKLAQAARPSAIPGPAAPSLQPLCPILGFCCPRVTCEMSAGCKGANTFPAAREKHHLSLH